MKHWLSSAVFPGTYLATSFCALTPPMTSDSSITHQIAASYDNKPSSLAGTAPVGICFYEYPAPTLCGRELPWGTTATTPFTLLSENEENYILSEEMKLLALQWGEDLGDLKMEEEDEDEDEDDKDDDNEGDSDRRGGK